MNSAAFASDPFPAIPPALLNSADLRAYAEAGAIGTRLFEPFNGKLKSASYEIPFRGASYSWKGDDPNRYEHVLEDGAHLEIPRNGIVFVWPAVYFRIPEYLALRFNLTIRLVHRGLLLGTGPLVDPGFCGRLLIPVHNLTNEPVKVAASDGFIWIEVTKISPYHSGRPHAFEYERFPEDKKNRQVGDYFEKANQGAPIQSSIPSIAEKSEAATQQLRDQWKAFREEQSARTNELRSELRRLEIGGFVAILLTVILAIGASLLSVWQIAESTKQLVESTKSLVLSAQQSAGGGPSRIEAKVEMTSPVPQAPRAPTDIHERTNPNAAAEQSKPRGSN